MAFLAILLPPLLWFIGKYAMSTPLQNSMSAYYHTELRDVFVGALIGIGFLLFLYKGFSRREDWALNISGILALGIALFPTNPWPKSNAAEQAPSIFTCKPLCDADCMKYSDVLDRTSQFMIDASLHGYCAVLFFIPIFLVCAVFSRETLKTIEAPRTRRTFMTIYLILGATMLVLPLVLLAMREFGAFGHNLCSDATIFAVEWALVWSFATFWIVKTIEMRINRADYLYPVRRAQKADKTSRLSDAE
jgi:hypothetical protein